jgi:ERCC4-type nuclease
MQIIVDTREQKPWKWASQPGVTTEKATLTAGDYSVKGHEKTIAIERKSLADLVQTLSRGRERFERECDRLLSFSYRTVVVEATLEQIFKHKYRSMVVPNAVIGSMCAIQQTWGLPFILAGGRKLAEHYAFRWLSNAVKYAEQEDV